MDKPVVSTSISANMKEIYSTLVQFVSVKNMSWFSDYNKYSVYKLTELQYT